MTPKEAYDLFAKAHAGAARSAAETLYLIEAGSPEDAPESFFEQLWESAFEGVLAGIKEAHEERGIDDPLTEQMVIIAFDAFLSRFDELNTTASPGGEA
jgi:hypothetical protein